jgi:hypothetical protein
MWILTLFKNRKIVIPLLLSAAIGIILLGAYHYLTSVGYRLCLADQQTKQIETREKQNEIRNNRPDDDEFFKRLLNATA